MMEERQTAEILIVEDDPLVRNFAVMLLEASGFRVQAAESADAALDLLHASAAETAVVFTDVQMPGEIDGVQLAHIVVDRWPSMTVLVTSGNRRSPHELPPGTRFLPKPWVPETVVAEIAQGLARRAQER